MKNVAISHAFWRASCYQDDRAFITKRFFDHSAISATNYSDVLYNVYGNSGKTKELFYWLLARADYQDLKVIKDDKRSPSTQLEFQKAVNDREKVVGSKTREEMGRGERIVLMKVALNNIIPKVLLSIVAEY